MSPEHPPGAFVAVVGQSGVGKDTLMSRAALQAALDPRVRFARRIVTRPALIGAEDHDSLDETAFARAEARGDFSLVWAAHGLNYALPRSIIDEIGRGCTMVANLSRHSLDAAAKAFGTLYIVEVTARPEIVLGRLSTRGRETEATILERLRRHVQINPASAAGFVQIDNSGDAALATDLLISHLNKLSETR